MIYVPLVYFFVLFVVVIKKCGLGMSACMIGAYAVSAFFSIVLYFAGYCYPLVDFRSITISVFPTILYCVLITICIIPFIQFDYLKFDTLTPIRNGIAFKALAYIFIFNTFLIVLLFSEPIIFNLSYGDLGELRVNSFTEEAYASHLTGISRVLSTPTTIIGHVSYFAIPMFFYSLVVSPSKWIFNTFLLLSSMSPILLGFLNIDRSKTFYWVLLFVMCFAWFRKFLREANQKKYIAVLGSVIITFVVVYFISVTVSRFGERDYGSDGAFIIYAGQSFLNFVNLWDNYENPIKSFFRIFPFFNFFFGGNQSTAEWCRITYVQSGMHINSFYTYLGAFLVDLGRVSVFIATVVISLFSKIIVDCVALKKKLSLSNVLLLFTFAIIIQCGVISYFYTGIDRFMGLLFLCVFLLVFKYSGD